MPVRRLRLTLEYDGTAYHGFQHQNGQRTVQDALERAIGGVTREECRVVAAGRTDAGVHAVGQVVHLGFAGGDAEGMMSFGYKKMENFVRYADKERAFLDVLYFYQRGHKFSFNIYSDIQVKKLDQKIIKRCLAHYKNPKFVKFVEGVCHEKRTV